MRKLFLTGLTALLLTAIATIAQASYVTDWNYSVDGIFTTWTADGPGTGKIAGKNAATLSYDYYQGAYDPGSKSGYRKLEWGSGREKSSISLIPKNGAMQTITTDAGTPSDGMTLVHNNYPLNGYDKTLRTGTVMATLSLTPLGEATGPVFASSLKFMFFETPNESPATEQDIFVVLNPYVGTETFVYQGYTYDFTFAASFAPLTGYYANYARNALGLSAGTPLYGWITPEDDSTSFVTKVQVRHETGPSPTPEPATLGLLGAGLAGLGAMYRRRNNVTA